MTWLAVTGDAMRSSLTAIIQQNRIYIMTVDRGSLSITAVSSGGRGAAGGRVHTSDFTAR